MSCLREFNAGPINLASVKVGDALVRRNRIDNAWTQLSCAFGLGTYSGVRTGGPTMIDGGPLVLRPGSAEEHSPTALGQTITSPELLLRRHSCRDSFPPLEWNVSGSAWSSLAISENATFQCERQIA